MITIHTKCDGCDQGVISARVRASELKLAVEYLRNYARYYLDYQTPPEESDNDYCPPCWEQRQMAKALEDVKP